MAEKERIEDLLWRPAVFGSYSQVQYAGTTDRFKETVGLHSGNTGTPELKLLKDPERLKRRLSEKMKPGKFIIRALRKIAPQADAHALIKTRLQHTDHIVVVDREFVSKTAQEKIDATFSTDGLITDLENVPLYVGGADCAPVAIFDPVKNLLGLFHSGWRGTALGIFVKGIAIMREKFGSKPEDLLVSVGPCISKNDFQVGTEIHESFARALSAEEMQLVFSSDGEEKFLCNLAEAIRIQLLNAGIREKNLEVSEMKTGGVDFLSARKSGGIEHIDGSVYILNLAKKGA